MKTAILIDNMYLEHVCQAYGIERLDYSEKLPKMLLRDGEVHFRTFVFDALPFVPNSPEPEQIERKDRKKKFLDKLQYLERISVEYGIVRPKSSTCPSCKNVIVVPVQKLVDVKISVRLVSLAWQKVVEKIVLVAGDSDLIPAVEAISGSGTTVRLAYAEIGDVRTSKALIRACPEKSLFTEDAIRSCLL